MIKRSLLLLLITFVMSCNTNKSVIQTSNRGAKSNSVVKNTKKTTDSKIETLEASNRIKVTQEMVLKYINNYKSIAQANMKKYGIPASIILGQALLESGSGTGSLCVQAQNHFGIKCGYDWLGESVRHNDDAIDECFRKYKNPQDSFIDHSLFLTGKKRYAALFNLDKTDYKSWAKGLKEAGYATDELYPTKLIALIEKYQLNQYDLNVDVSSYRNQNKIPETNAVFESHTVSKGDTLYSISKKYNVSIDDLKRNNRLENDALAVGQTINILK
jgi:flagellum-specific peptidoglycan hydrolase FlgJ